MKIYLEPDLSGSSDEQKILGDMNGKILSMLAINNHNIQALVYHFIAADFKKEDLLTPSITVTEEEKRKMSSDVTRVNTREERIEMALSDVLEEYNHTRIDERYIITITIISFNGLYTMMCSKLPWPIPKIRAVVKKYEVN